MTKTAIAIIFYALLLLVGCGKNPDNNNGASGPVKSGAGDSTAAREPAVGDNVLYMFDEYNFYEAKLLGIEGGKAKLEREGSNIERPLSDVYTLPSGGGAYKSLKPGDYVAARYGNLPTWPTAEVVKVGDNTITVKRIISGSVEELSPNNVLVLRPEAQARIKEGVKKK
ncbi:MAG: hypothetical protein M3362_06920 [Acidobacteriota bacterium]|nr:hypothetical protein [Acidobacteriota bacterium]